VALTEAAYGAGARYVDVLETDPRITRARALLAGEDTLDWRPAWEDSRMRGLVREGAGIVWIAGSEDPQALADVPPARAVRWVSPRYVRVEDGWWYEPAHWSNQQLVVEEKLKKDKFKFKKEKVKIKKEKFKKEKFKKEKFKD